jgi:hypothetical protein
VDEDRDSPLDAALTGVSTRFDTVKPIAQPRQGHQEIDAGKKNAKNSLDIAIGGRLAAAKDPPGYLVPPLASPPRQGIAQRVFFGHSPGYRFKAGRKAAEEAHVSAKQWRDHVGKVAASRSVPVDARLGQDLVNRGP